MVVGYDVLKLTFVVKLYLEKLSTENKMLPPSCESLSFIHVIIMIIVSPHSDV